MRSEADNAFENLELFTDVKARFGSDPSVTIGGKTGRLGLNKTFWNQVNENSKGIKYLYILHAIENEKHFVGLSFSSEKRVGAISVSPYAKSGASASIKSFLDKYKINSNETKTYSINVKNTQKFGKIYYFIIEKTS